MKKHITTLVKENLADMTAEAVDQDVLDIEGITSWNVKRGPLQADPSDAGVNIMVHQCDPGKPSQWAHERIRRWPPGNAMSPLNRLPG